MSQIEEQIKQLESQLTGNLLQDLDTREEIHNLKMQMNGVESCACILGEDCVGCGS